MQDGQEDPQGRNGHPDPSGAADGSSGPEEEGLAARLRAVRSRIARAAGRVGRDPSTVEVLPITKGHPAYVIREAAEAGVTAIGENRVGEAEEKRTLLGGGMGLRWHMVGRLQRNKARRAVGLFDVVESVDSLRLARRIDAEAEAVGRETVEVLLQVNASGEEAKGGFRIRDEEGRRDALAAITAACALPRLRVEGLMTMAPFTSDEDVLRRTFATTRDLFARCGEEVEGFRARVLSMGMTNDFELAVEEGSTRVRLGTVLFGERPNP